LDQLLEKNDFSVPQAMIDDEIRGLLIRNGVIDPSKTDPAKISVEAFREQLGEVASKRVKTAIVVDRIADKENLAATDEDLDKAILDIAENNSLPEGDVRRFFAEGSRKLDLALEQTRARVLDFLYSRTEVKELKEEKKKKTAKTPGGKGKKAVEVK